MKKLILGVLLCCYGGLLIADTVQLKKDHPEVYHVKKGDTLWDISSTFLEDPWRWPDIWHLNPQVDNPHLIFPGDKLALIQVEEEKKLTVVERGPIKISPVGETRLMPRVRTRDIETAIPAIPLEKINAFLSRARIVDLDDLDQAPYVLAGENRRIVTGAGDKLYARGDFDMDDNAVFGIYRAGRTFIDPVTQELLGVQAEDIGGARLVAVNSDVGTLQINRSAQEIRINDRLLPTQVQTLTSVFYPQAPAEQVEGQIIGIEGSLSRAGKMDVVMINLGEREGLRVGHVLSISQTGEVVRDRVRNQLVQLPDVRAGLLIVFRTFEKMSLGLVLSTDTPLTAGDKVFTP